MVRRQVNKVKKKPARASQVQRKIMDKKHFGDEPALPAGLLSQGDLMHHFNWYNYMCDRSDSTEFRLEYLKANHPKDYKVQKAMDEKLFSLTSGWICRLLTRGAKVAPETMEFLERDFEKAKISEKLRMQEQEVSKLKKANAPSVDRSRERADLIIGDIEEAIENLDPEFKVYEFLSGREVPSTWDKYFPRYEGLIAEYRHFLEGTDEQVVEAYAKRKKTKVRAQLRYLEGVVDEVDRYFGNRKAVRKPRVKKEPTVDKKLRHIEFKREDKEYQVVSLDSRQMDGAKVIWIFNSKYLNVTKLTPTSEGFDFKGKSILNFEGETRSIRRKTKEFLKDFLEGGHVTKRKMFEALKGKPSQFSGRINNEMVLLAVQR